MDDTKNIIDNKILELVYNVIDEINEQLHEEDQLKKSVDTALFGASSGLDSLGLVRIIIAVEQEIEDNLGVTVALADERAMSQKYSPFRTVGSLLNYIEMILEEELSD